MNQLVIPILCLTSLKLGTWATESESPLVKTGKGILKGRFETSRNGNQYEVYLGIQYGSIPKRFDVSVPTGSWTGIKNASEFGPHCAQLLLSGSGGTGVEDCLTLNVFTPKSDGGKRGVLVYIYGGGFTYGGSSDYGGDYLMDEDIVLVTINYRLGALGFLNSRDGLVTGNMGLKDQVLALKWIQENIEHFGGDKGRVTISGNSAGGASTLYLMSSPLAHCLFHGVLSFSGTSLNPWASNDNSVEDMKHMGRSLSCNVEDTAELIECLRKEPIESLVLAQKSLSKWDMDLFRMVPSVEMKTENNQEPFLDEFPEERLREVNFGKVPVMMTMTPDEGLLLYAGLVTRNEALLKDLNENFKEIGPITFQYGNEKRFTSRKDFVSNRIQSFYFDGKPITRENEQNLTNLYTDVNFLRGIEKTSHILGDQMSVYTGLFTHPRKDYSPLRLFGIQDPIENPIHCSELSYMFSPTGAPHPLPLVESFKEEKDVAFSKKFVQVIANFVKTGKPQLANPSMEWMPVSKEEIESDRLNWFNLGEEDFVHVNPFEKRLQFWKELEKDRKDEL